MAEGVEPLTDAEIAEMVAGMGDEEDWYSAAHIATRPSRGAASELDTRALARVVLSLERRVEALEAELEESKKRGVM